MFHYRAHLHAVLKHTNFPIDSRVEIRINRTDFENDFDMYVKQINFDLSTYHMRYFVASVYSPITYCINRIDNLTNCITIEDLERLTKCGYKVVYDYSTHYQHYFSMLVKVCPKTVKYKDNDISDGYYINKKDDFICEMPKKEFAIETDEGTHIIINKTNIDEYL